MLNINTFNLILFLFLAILGAYWLFLPLYYQSCDFSLIQIGTLIAVKNLAGLFGHFLATISDFFRKTKTFLKDYYFLHYYREILTHTWLKYRSSSIFSVR